MRTVLMPGGDCRWKDEQSNFPPRGILSVCRSRSITMVRKQVALSTQGLDGSRIVFLGFLWLQVG